ncbi:MAG TPA: hypothetical protein PLB12_02085 [Candidatus Goldiibacteriota bacterium]|nr:hypothetical protein [Candidatus Goldiibacteriota bacterium]HPN64085.1 hypothetical protein [Candidatus Goldiibacteriota bacterium]HRQ43123.1 hypothetical protein [Candidatus Goldiibacteriota bacterium]
MKKIILLILMLLAASCAFGMQLINLSGNYYQPYGDLGGKNYLSWHAWRLEKTHGINVVIFNETKEEKTDPKAKASEYLPLAIKNKEDKAISIYLNKYMRRGAIAISENLTGIMPPEYIEYLEEDLIRRMMWRWYTSDTKVLGKVLGAFIYNLEKNTLSKDDLRRQKDGIINIDDNVYLFSKKQPFNDIIKLFFAEPISFMFYFPLITFFLMVRVVYLIWGEKAGKIMRAVWVLFMLMILLLIIKRLDVFYAEYLWTFNLFTALMFPFYIYLAVMYKEQIVIMAQNYAEKITGFNGINAFEGEKWPK